VLDGTVYSGASCTFDTGAIYARIAEKEREMARLRSEYHERMAELYDEIERLQRMISNGIALAR